MNKKTPIEDKKGFIAKEAGNPYTTHLPALPGSSTKLAAVKSKKMDVEIYSTPSRQELSQVEGYRKTGFDLDQMEKELLQQKPRDFFDWLFGFDPDKDELERIKTALDKIRVRYELREEIVRFELQKSRMEEALFDAKLSMMRKRTSYELELQHLKTEKAELELTEQRLRKRIRSGKTSSE